MDTGDKPAEEDVVSGSLKRRIVIAAVVLGVVGLGGTALATSSSGGNSFMDDVAHRLGVSPAKLQNAIKGAQADQLNKLVKQGRLTRAQANAIEKRLKQRNGAPFAGPFGGFRHHGFRGGPRPFFGFGRMGPLETAASYLGITQDALGKDLRAGKALAAIAKANGKSVAGLETAMLAPAKTHLDSAVKAGRLTKIQARRFLKMLSGGIDRLVTKGFRFDGPMHHGWDDGDHGMQNGAKSAPTAFGL
jgi:AraC-like DNA-binding protein